MNRRTQILIGCVALAASVAMAGPSFAVLYTSGTWSSTFPGPYTPPPPNPDNPLPHPSYPGDTVTLLGHSGTLDLVPGSYVKQLNTLDWIIDWTWGGDDAYNDEGDWDASWPDLSIDFTMVSDFTIGTATGTISQGGRLSINWDNDYVSLFDGPASLFQVDGYNIRVTPLAMAAVGGSNFDPWPIPPWNQPDLNVMARFEVEPVPEPSGLVLTGLRLAFVGGGSIHAARRRKAS